MWASKQNSQKGWLIINNVAFRSKVLRPMKTTASILVLNIVAVLSMDIVVKVTLFCRKLFIFWNRTCQHFRENLVIKWSCYQIMLQNWPIVNQKYYLFCKYRRKHSTFHKNNNYIMTVKVLLRRKYTFSYLSGYEKYITQIVTVPNLTSEF